MDAYIDITLQPDDEFPQHLLMDALIAKLHKALIEEGAGSIAISFPQWRNGPYPSLGGIARLHGNMVDLQRHMQRNWLHGMRDHVCLGEPSPVPEQHGHVLVERKKTKSPNNMRKRAMRRHGLTQQQAEARIPDSAACRLDFPYTTQYSASTGQRYRLFIAQSLTKKTDGMGLNSHGLSTGAAVPMF